MIIHIQDEIIELANDSTKIEEYFEIINEILINKYLKFEYLIIDGQPIYKETEYYEYFKIHITEIKKVEVVTSLGPLIKETITSTNKYLDNAIAQVSTLTEEFYQQPCKKTWLKLMDLFEGIQWIVETVLKINSIKGLEKFIVNYEIWNEYVQTVAKLSAVVFELEASMLSKDYVLIGDLLLYEIIPIFEKMLDSLKFLLTNEKGFRNVS